MGRLAENPTETRQRATQADRLKARTEYIQGRGSVREVAERNGLSFHTVRGWCDAEDWKTLRTKYAANELARLMGSDGQQPQPAPAVPAQNPQNSPQAERLMRQMERIEEMMENGHNGRPYGAASLKDFAAAHSKLFEAWCVLTGTPRPGVRRPARGRSTGNGAGVQPVEPVAPPSAAYARGTSEHNPNGNGENHAQALQPDGVNQEQSK